MAGSDIPTLPRLSPIGWSIDDSGDLHSAVFDIADSLTEFRSGESTQHEKMNDQRMFSSVDDSPTLESQRRFDRLTLQMHQHKGRQSEPQQQHQQYQQRRPPLKEWDSAVNGINRPTTNLSSTGSNPRSPSSREYPPRVDRHLGRPTKRPSTSDGAIRNTKSSSSSSFVAPFGAGSSDISGISPKARNNGNRPSSSRGNDREILSNSTDKSGQEQNLSRSSSIFKLKRPFRRRKNTMEPNEEENKNPQQSDNEAGVQPSSASGSSVPSNGTNRVLGGFRDLVLTNSRKSVTSSRADSFSGASGRPSSDIENVLGVRQRLTSFGTGRDSFSTPKMSDSLENQRSNQVPTISLPRPSLTSSSEQSRPRNPGLGDSSGSNSNIATPTSSIRRKVRPPQAQAPNLPLPPPPMSHPTSAPAVIVGQFGDPADEIEDLLFTSNPDDETISSQKENLSFSSSLQSEEDSGRGSVRKVKSQTSTRMLRRPSILSNFRNYSFSKEQSSIDSNPSKGNPTPSSASISPTTSRKVEKDAKWEVLQGSHLDMGESSPEMERLSLSQTDDSKDVSSSPSLEEARWALGTSMNESGRSGTNALEIPGVNYSNGQIPSRLESNGGVAGLFGGSSSSSSNGGSNGSNVRPRASSLLPWKSRASSQPQKDGNISPNTPLIDASSSSSASSLQNQQLQQARKSSQKISKIDVEKFNGDSDAFVREIMEKYPREDVPAILASSADDLYKNALRIFMQRFLFTGHPLDVALRKMLMTLYLPKETQQIDRVMEAFAKRYNECNENLFENDDQPYVLAFSLMMLHTDTFNKNAKQKMSRADYVRNTSASGVATEILEYLYDNLTFTQFIYVEDEAYLYRRKSENDTISMFKSAFTSSNSANKARVDPYHIIASGQTHTLRAKVEIEEDSPFSAKGTLKEFDIESLLQSFVNSPSIEIVTARKTGLPTATAALGGYYTTLPMVSKEEEAIVTLRITKVGCVGRKGDVEDGKKSQSRKWKTCGMILSSSQLLFFRDLVWTSALDQRITEQMAEQPNKEGGVLITPRITYFKPDGVLALGDAIAVRDSTYSKYKHVFRLVTRQGEMMRQYLIQTPNEEEMNDWIHKINFCGAFRSAGLRVKGLDIASDPLSNPSSPQSMVANNNHSSDFATPSSPISSLTSAAMSPATITSMSSNSIEQSSGNVPMVGLLRRKLNARFRELTPVIEKMTKLLRKYELTLEQKLRLARHLTIATPFSKLTRERLELLSFILSQEIRQLRLDVARYACRREILILELEAGNRAAKASASSSAFEEDAMFDEDEKSWQAGSPLSLTPIDTSSRASSFTQSRSGSASFIGDPNIPVPKLPSPMLGGDQSSSSALNSPNLTEGGKSPEMEMATPTMKVVGLHEVETSGKGGNIHNGKFHFNGSVDNHSNSSPNNKSNQRDQLSERWDRTKMGKSDKRVSLVNLPDPHQWQALTPRLAMAANLSISPPSSPSPQKINQKQKKTFFGNHHF